MISEGLKCNSTLSSLGLGGEEEEEMNKEIKKRNGNETNS